MPRAYGSEYGMDVSQGLRRDPNMSNYTSIRPNNACICLNVSQYA